MVGLRENDAFLVCSPNCTLIYSLICTLIFSLNYFLSFKFKKNLCRIIPSISFVQSCLFIRSSCPVVD